MAKYSPSGLCQWAKVISGIERSNVFIYSIKVNNSGDIFATGFFSSNQYESDSINFNNGKITFNPYGTHTFRTK